MRRTYHPGVVYAHVVLHDGKIAGFGREPEYQGETVKVFGWMVRGDRHPRVWVMHQSWLRPIRMPISERQAHPVHPGSAPVAELSR